YPLDRKTVFILGKALVELLQQEGLPPRILIGRDTRESGFWIEEILFQGILAGRGEAVSAGVIPTSAVSFLTRKHGFSSGIVISASHNPYQDNGIKVFSPKGLKISEDWETRLEKAIASGNARLENRNLKISANPALAKDYQEFLAGQLRSAPAGKRLKLAVDCANGASSAIAPRLFSDLGFSVTAIHSAPNGKNINLGCGALHPEELASTVLAERADLGIAYDGDSDRAIWVDEKGRILNGDHTLFVQARDMKMKKQLKSNAVVATTMSNMGLEKALGEMGIELVRTRVGDKYVLEKMMELGSNLGGEQSGHTIFLDECPTGDGLLTSLKMLDVMRGRQASLSELAAELPEFPQVLLNVRVKGKPDFSRFPEIIEVMEEVKRQLADSGRLDVRYSGTEPLARIMVEGEDRTRVESLARRIAGVIAQYLGKGDPDETGG
ncbi:MAG: phosphoglucosamine mutase, partial [Candidatus Aminicenantes bacterium]|nr:phosphoglucosamine mutase [Candidatus Aminicenantes bacterium]